MLYRLRTWVFTGLFWLWGLLMALAMLLAMPLGSPVLGKLKRAWLRGNMGLARWILNIRYHVRGLDHIPTQGSCLFAMKHQSAWDSFLPGLILSNPGYVLKRELLSIPLFGALVQRWPVVAVERGRAAVALKALVTQAQTLVAQQDLQLVIFPEGTRAKPGQPGKYQIGVAVLYDALQVPLVPVALNSGQHWGKGWRNFAPGTIQVDILPPIPPGLERRQALSLLEQRIETRVAELEQSAD